MDVDVGVDLIDHRGGRPPAGVAGDEQVPAGGVKDSIRERMPEGMGFHPAQAGPFPGPSSIRRAPAVAHGLPRLPPCNWTSSIP